MKLTQALQPQDKTKLQQFYPSLDFDEIEVRIQHMDGAGKRGGSAKSKSIFRAIKDLELDSADVSRNIDGTLNLSHPLTLEILLHELFHILQSKRGFFYRLKMRWWNWRKDYADRPHENEAFAESRRMMQSW